MASISSVRAQVTATVSPPVIGAGQTAEYSLTIENGHQIQQLPTNLAVPGLEFNGPSSRNSMSLTNGVLRQQTEFVWQIFAANPGLFTIPGQQVIVNGQALSVPEKTLQVQEGVGPRHSYEPLLTLQVEQPEIFVGEVVPLKVTALFHRRTQLRNYEPPKLPRDNFVVKRFAQPLQGELVEAKGERYQSIVFSSSLSAIKEGLLNLGPATLDCVVDFPSEGSGARTPTPGFPSFFQRTITRQIHLESNVLKITIKPLPTEGRPADFSGAVGKFTLSARLNQPPQVRMGDPLAVDLTVAGQGNFDSVAAPLLASPEGWKIYPPKQTQENRSLGLEPGVVSFSQVIIPQKMAQQVPPFQLSYFDLDQKKYVTVQSNAIPLQMTPEEKAAPAGSDEAPTKDFAISEAAIPEERLADILTVRPEGAELRNLTPRKSDAAVFWGIQAVPAALVLTFAGMGLQRRLRLSAEETRRRRIGHPRASLVILRQMKRPGLAARDFYALAREFVDSREFYHGRAGTASGLNGELEQILARQTRLSYAGLAEAAAPISSKEQKEVVATLSRLER
ncbi:MAG: BatD family protein [Verrucomicrobiales bacterium]